MKSLWNMLNKEFTIEGAVSAFLVINIIAWTLITMGAGMLVCKFLGFSIGGNMTNLMCAGIYGGLIVGLTEESCICMSYTDIILWNNKNKYIIIM